MADGVSAERRMVDKKIAHTVLLWEVGRRLFVLQLCGRVQFVLAHFYFARFSHLHALP